MINVRFTSLNKTLERMGLDLTFEVVKWSLRMPTLLAMLPVVRLSVTGEAVVVVVEGVPTTLVLRVAEATLCPLIVTTILAAVAVGVFGEVSANPVRELRTESLI
jgi:hypothetical protein